MFPFFFTVEQVISLSSERHLWSVEQNLLHVPWHRSSMCGRCPFAKLPICPPGTVSQVLSATWTPPEPLTAACWKHLSAWYSRQAGVSGFWCRSLELPASPHRITTVTRGFQATTPDISVFPFIPRHYHMTHVLLLPFITTVWTPKVFAIIII